MSEVIGFVLGVIICIVLAIIFIPKLIFNTTFLIVVLAFAIIFIIAYILNKKSYKKIMEKRKMELQDVLNKYMTLRKKAKLPKNADIIIVDTYTNIDTTIIVGENIIYKEKGYLCFYPNYPTIDNYLLFDEFKETKIKIDDIKSIKIIGEINKSTDFYGKIVKKNINIDLFLEDNRRTELTYIKDKQEYYLIMDFYAYDKIKKLIK